MDKVNFSLTYSALKMFGKQLYSNVGSAISELVANGLDAKANNVYLTIDMRNKETARIEIFDDGKGMSSEDIRERYVIIGFNKRKKEDGMNDGKTMGRKGIGKLAALYLSNCFTIFTKTEKSEITAWKLDVRNMDDDETPAMEQVVNCDLGLTFYPKTLEKYKKGTIIVLDDVNLTGLGDRALESLTQRLSTLFLYEKLNQGILIKIINNDSDIDKEYIKIEKKIAYKNMSYAFVSNESYAKEVENNRYTLAYTVKTGAVQKATFDSGYENMERCGIKIMGEKEFFGKKKQYKLEGWIGIHSSIDNDIALANDSRYIKNRFYNPNQIRVYVRNKLAMANIIEYLGITRAFANYFEGEITFNILDDDDLPDIATAGRQDFDTQDPRFFLLKELVAKIGNALVAKRQAVGENLGKIKKAKDLDISSKAKAIALEEIQEELDQMLDLSPENKKSIASIAMARYEGENPPESKTEYTVFISHSGQDRIFSDCIFYYLKNLGFNCDLKSPNCEIFYSSNGLDTDNLNQLSLIIKDFIVRKENDILFMPSKHFRSSEFCLFEGGAAWATKTIGDYKILGVNYGDIPVFLSNGKSEACLGITKPEEAKLDKAKYEMTVKVVNRLICHLNKNRGVMGQSKVALLSESPIPDKVKLAEKGKNESDYMDKDLLKYWNAYILDGIDGYLGTKKGK